MLDALETLLQHCSPSMKLKDAQLRCHELPVEYDYLETGAKVTISGYVLDGPKTRHVLHRSTQQEFESVWERICVFGEA